MKTFEFTPIYYLGWIIQPTLEGFWVYQRIDTSKSHSLLFRTADEAYKYIHSVIKYEER